PETFHTAASFPVIAKQNLARRIVKLCPDELSGAGRGFKIRLVIEDLGAPGKGRKHPAVPGRDDLVVQMRSRPLRPNREQGPARVPQNLRDLAFAFANVLRRLGKVAELDQDVFAGEFTVRIATRWNVAFGFDGVMEIEKLGV